MAHWTHALGVGPFFHFAEARVTEFVFRGEPCDARIAVAFANSGPLQIELIQTLDGAASSYREFLSRHEAGLQHVAYWTESFEEACSRAQSAGHDVLQSGRSGGDPRGRHAYFDSPEHHGPLVEISEVAGAKGAFFSHVARVAAEWDGSEPVRQMGIAGDGAVPQ